jgi:hypothetical protein
MAEDASVKPLVDPLLTILVTMLDQFARLTKQVLDMSGGKRSAGGS